VLFGCIPQRVTHDARLDTGGFSIRIQLENSAHVFREIQDDSDVAALARQAGSCASRQHWSAVPPARREGCDHVLGVAWNDEADRHLAVVGAIRRVQRAAPAIEADLAPDRPRQIAFQFGGWTKRINRFCV
jgi:hypothetical protein